MDIPDNNRNYQEEFFNRHPSYYNYNGFSDSKDPLEFNDFPDFNDQEI